MPGKGSVPMAEYEAAWDEAVRLFGPNRVSTYLLVGLGEDPDELVEGAARLIDRGVYPFVVPFRPMAGTLARRDGATAPPPSLVREVTARVGALLQAAGMAGSDQGAGCAACGACSALPAAGG
jgi:biotin synthase-related radical SAM superfamily protein